MHRTMRRGDRLQICLKLVRFQHGAFCRCSQVVWQPAFNRYIAGSSPVTCISRSHSQAAKTPALHAGNKGSIPFGIIWDFSRNVMMGWFNSLRRQYCGLAQLEAAAGSEPADQRFESFIRS